MAPPGAYCEEIDAPQGVDTGRPGDLDLNTASP
jgi:hypothetical protein